MNHPAVHPTEQISLATLLSIQAESMRATLKHGFANTNLAPNLPSQQKLINIMEEVGEVAQLLTYDHLPNFVDPVAELAWRNSLREELIQVANLAAAFAQSQDARIMELDRQVATLDATPTAG